MRFSVGRTVAKTVSPVRTIFRARLGAVAAGINGALRTRNSSREIADTSTYRMVSRGSLRGFQVLVGRVTSPSRIKLHSIGCGIECSRQERLQEFGELRIDRALLLGQHLKLGHQLA